MIDPIHRGVLSGVFDVIYVLINSRQEYGNYVGSRSGQVHPRVLTGSHDGRIRYALASLKHSHRAKIPYTTHDEATTCIFSYRELGM